MSEEIGKVKIGLEVHCQLTSLQTKLFCNTDSNYRGKLPNTTICPVCMGTPGSLPVMNRKAVHCAAMVALALNFKISKRMFFFRKNYFYPDMSKNFQITQYDRAGGVPFATDGSIILDSGKKIKIGRMHLEEDPAKLNYDGTIDSSTQTLVDYNRAGIALIEIVTDPDMTNPKEAREFLNKLSSILEHLGVSNPSLEGSVRCDANISLTGGRRVEVKNISSFKEVERALNFEITRQKSLTSKGITIVQETRHWDDIRRITISLRVKEEEQDYRYFPEADLPPIIIEKQFIDNVAKEMPELPIERAKRFQKENHLSQETSQLLVREKILADFFEDTLKSSKDAREVASWLTVDLQAYLNERGEDLKYLKTTPKHFAELSDMVHNSEVSRISAKTIFLDMLKTGRMPRQIAQSKDLKIITDSSFVENIVKKVFNDNPKAVEDATRDEKAINFLIGQIMRQSRGQVNPATAHRIVNEKLFGAKKSK